MIAGFQTASEGEIKIAGKEITQTPPHKRPVNTVFQKYALFPHLNVFDNIAFGLKLKKTSKQTIEKKVKAALRMVGMTDYEYRDVNSLSGGQQQRVAIARAIVNEPEVLLLDEPLAALDLKMRKDMQMELKEMHKTLGITFVYVTHDQEEALTLSDTIVVMSEGKIQQIGTPVNIYNEPINSFVADFIGESNILNGTMIQDKLVRFAGVEFECVDEGFGENMPVDVVVRPEDWYIFPDSDASQISGIVTSSIFKGVHYEMVVETNGFEKEVWMNGNAQWVMTNTDLQTTDQLTPNVYNDFTLSPYAMWTATNVNLIEFPKRTTLYVITVNLNNSSATKQLFYTLNGRLLQTRDVSV